MKKNYLLNSIFALFFISNIVYAQNSNYVVPDGNYLQIGNYTNSNDPKGILFTGFRDLIPNYFGASIEAVNDWTCCNGYPNGGYPGIKYIGLDFNLHRDSDLSSDKFTAMSIKSNGNIGIGTNNPQSLLELKTNDDQRLLINYQNKSAVTFIPNNGNSWFNISHGLKNDLAISHGSNVDNERLVTIKNNGFVGIGTKEPREALDVVGHIKVGDNENSFWYGGADISLRASSRGSGGRALVHDGYNMLALNYDGDFTGGTKISQVSLLRTMVMLHFRVK